MSGQDLPLGFIDNAGAQDCLFVAHHHREGFDRAMLPLTKARHRLLRCGVATQVESADSLHRQDLPFGQHLPGETDRVMAALISSQKINLRTAVIAADRLCIIPSRGGILILFRTPCAHGKFLHAGPGTVIGQLIENRQPRATLRTVDEGVKIPPVPRIEQLPPAFLTGGDIR